MTFETREYRNNHGAEPRGRGSWAFSTKRCPNADNPEIFWVHGVTYAEAKKVVKAEFKKRNKFTLVTLWVLP